jgi:hypothetical protein
MITIGIQALDLHELHWGWALTNLSEPEKWRLHNEAILTVPHKLNEVKQSFLKSVYTLSLQKYFVGCRYVSCYRFHFCVLRYLTSLSYHCINISLSFCLIYRPYMKYSCNSTIASTRPLFFSCILHTMWIGDWGSLLECLEQVDGQRWLDLGCHQQIEEHGYVTFGIWLPRCLEKEARTSHGGNLLRTSPLKSLGPHKNMAAMVDSVMRWLKDSPESPWK